MARANRLNCWNQGWFNIGNEHVAHLIYFWLCGSLLLCRIFSLVAKSSGYSLVVVHGFFNVVASSVAEHELQALSHCDFQVLWYGLCSCGAWAQLLHCMWNLPRPGIELLSPALAGRLITTEPAGKSGLGYLMCRKFIFLFCLSFYLSSLNINILFLLSSFHIVTSLRARVAEGLGVIDTQRF